MRARGGWVATRAEPRRAARDEAAFVDEHLQLVGQSAAIFGHGGDKRGAERGGFGHATNLAKAATEVNRFMPSLRVCTWSSMTHSVPGIMASGEQGRTRRHWSSIQYLRGVAALLVVVFHICATVCPGNPFLAFKAGAHGVDVFLVISGFVMYTAARSEPVATFFHRRLIRIAPLYWIATSVFVTINILITGAPISRLNLIRSMLFIPFFNPSFNGKVWPLLVPGWTLSYEAFFYALFGFALYLRRPMIVVWLIIPVLVLCGLTYQPHNALWQTYTSQLLMEFAAGMLIGWLATWVELGRLSFLLPVGAVAIILSDFVTLPPTLYAGTAACCVVLGALALESSGRLRRSRSALLLGDASYSIYLCHVLYWRCVQRALRRLGFPPMPGTPCSLASDCQRQ